MESIKSDVDLAGLREVVSHLAAIHRPSASPGEREAAEWIASRLREQGCAAEVEKEMAHGGYWWPVGLLTAVGAVGGLLSLLGSRLLGFVFRALAAAAIADVARRLAAQA